MQARCSLKSAVLRGVDAVPVTVEVAVTNGLPAFTIVGMADTAVQEARERVKASIRASEFSMPSDKVVVNLAPSDIRKIGSGFDLPIALGILAVTGQINPKLLEDKLFVGELSLEGFVRPVTGTLAYGICAHKMGCSLVSSGHEVVPIGDLEQLSIKTLAQMHLEQPFSELPAYVSANNKTKAANAPDFKDVCGHEVAKRAMQIAAIGKHGVIMVGPPGSGKTMLASRIGSIMPPLEEDEILEAAVVHSVAGQDISGVLAGIRPFRAPHHSASTPGLIGGGSPIRPGEISLAHCGTLFLDEFPEFKVSTLQALRQPIESGKVSITRADGNIVFPSKFMLVAAANPCPCGYLGDSEHKCTCTVPKIRKYQSRMSGPLKDRIDIRLDVRRLPPGSVLNTGSGTSSEQLREGVLRGTSFAKWRESKESDNAVKADALRKLKKSSKEIIDSCKLSDESKSFLISMSEAYSLSGRALISVLSVARTIADMEESCDVVTDHLAEALAFRVREGSGEDACSN